MHPLRAIDVCCGAGGWIAASRGLPIKWIAAIDWAADCCLSVRYNYPDVPVIRADATRIDWQRFAGKVDLITGAIPCEEISIARSNIELSESDLAAWHNLLDSIIAGCQAASPKYWVIENVTPMKKHLYPLTPYMILNSKSWSGQARTRLYVGQFPQPRPGRESILGDYLRPGPHVLPLPVYRATQPTDNRWYSAGTKRLLQADQPSPTISAFGSRRPRGFVVPLSDGRERVLTLTEAATLQGFPSDYVFVATQTRAWKMVAQAVQIDTARAILKGIVKRSEERRVGKECRSRWSPYH